MTETNDALWAKQAAARGEQPPTAAPAPKKKPAPKRKK